MRQHARLLCALLLALAAAFVAAGATAQDLAAIPPLKARVTDLTGTLSAEQRSALEQTLAEFEVRKGAQIGVLLVASTAPEPIEQYALRVEEAWKLGRKGVDDGALLVVAKDDRKVRIEVGYGLEGVLPDAIAKRVIEEDITPRFRQGDFYGGIRTGVDRLMRLVEGEKLPPPGSRGTAPGGGFRFPEHLIFAVVIILLVGGAMRAIFGRFLGAGAAGMAAGAIGWVAAGAAIGLLLALIAFFFTLLGGGPRARRLGGYGGGFGGGWGSGGFGGGSFGGGGFSGGGGGSGGGGASGSW